MTWLLLLACDDDAVTETGLVTDSECVEIDWYADQDGDGVGGESVTAACEAPAGHVLETGDCDDTDAAVFPGADEVCNSLDDDCDGEVDTDASDEVSWYEDLDEDGYGGALAATSCEAPQGSVGNDLDCDDDDPDIHPDGEEIAYDGIDQDCDGSDWDDLDGDGSSWPEDCDDDDATRSPDFYEVCDDGIDNDCDDEVDSDCQYFGGIAPRDPTAVIYGTKESVACCGSKTGHFLHGGDLDDDGIGDLVFWSESDGNEIKVHYGPFSGEISTDDADARINLQDPQGSSLLYPLSMFIADVTGDALPDVLVGEPAADGLGVTSGAVSVYEGPVSGWYAPDDQAYMVSGERLDMVGASLATADLSGDGDADLVVGAPDSGQYEGDGAGSLVVVSGPLNGDVSDAACGDYPGIEYSGGGYGDIGVALATADVTGDGQQDLLTLSGRGTDVDWNVVTPVFLVLEGPVTNCTPHADIPIQATWDDAWILTRELSVGSVDANADGHADALISATLQAEDVTSVAAAYLLVGPMDELSSTDDASARFEFALPGAPNITSTPAGDLDGDGWEDVAFGLTEVNGQQTSGAVYVLFGPLSGTYEVEDDAFGILEGQVEPFESCETDGCEHPGSLFGWSLLAGDDYTGDGHPDLVIGAPGFEHDTSTNDKGPGAVYIYSGR